MGRRGALAAAGAALAAALVVGGFLAAPWVRVYTGAAPPQQYDRPLSPPVAAPTRDVLVAAHNAGNNATTTRRALEHGADIIEIDVTMARGRLVAGRAHGFAWLAQRVFAGSTLAQAWDYAGDAPTIKLDLQRSDPALLDELAAFLRQRAVDRPVLVSTRDADAIASLRPRVPAAVSMLFTAAFPDAVARLQSDPGLVAMIGGVSAFRGLASRSLVAWAHARGLLVLAWSANDAQALQPLLDAGVDGVTTANLAIVDLLSG